MLKNIINSQGYKTYTMSGDLKITRHFSCMKYVWPNNSKIYFFLNLSLYGEAQVSLLFCHENLILCLFKFKRMREEINSKVNVHSENYILVNILTNTKNTMITS